MVEAPEAPHHHHHKTGVPWFDLIVPVAVLCISVASLMTSLQSEKSMHALVEQNRRLVEAQSTPLLMLDTGNYDGTKMALSMTLSNVGTGPARLGWFHVVDDAGNRYENGALYGRVAKVNPGSVIMSEVLSGNFVRVGEDRTVFRWPKPINNKSEQDEWDKLNTERFHLHSSACYCSMFDECRITEFGDSHPKPVASCDEGVVDQAK